MFEKSRAPFDTLLPLVLLGLLALGCLVVLLPFLTAVLWACILAYSTWPAYLHLHRSFGSRSWAAGVMTLTVATVIILPAVLVGSELVENSAPVIASIQSFLNDGLPSPPGWISSIPLVGPTLAAQFGKLASIEVPEGGAMDYASAAAKYADLFQLLMWIGLGCAVVALLRRIVPWFEEM